MTPDQGRTRLSVSDLFDSELLQVRQKA